MNFHQKSLGLLKTNTAYLNLFVKNKTLAREIMNRVAAEQKVRKASVSGKAKRSQYKALDKKNSKWLKSVLEKFGWPTFSLVGKSASDGAWLLVQHADHDVLFQKYALSLMKKALKRNPKEVSKMRIAYLTDRILLNEHKPLIFGTMYKVDGLKVTLYPIKNSKQVDARRKTWGIKTTVEGRRQALIRELKKLRAGNS